MAQINREHSGYCDHLSQYTTAASLAIDEHKENEPRQGLFSSRARHASWLEKGEELERAHQRAEDDIEQYYREHLSDPGAIEVDAQKKGATGAS